MSSFIELNCSFCAEKFQRIKGEGNRSKNKYQNYFCSKKCVISFYRAGETVNCKKCNTSFYKKAPEIKKTLNHFCSKSCANSYNNSNKTYGIRRSKIEIFLQENLNSLYPDLNVIYNQKSIISSELDIYLPDLKVAFEINGIFHYEPIYGDEKFEQIKLNDIKKAESCKEQNITLHTIDVSKLKNFKKELGIKYLEEVKGIIDETLNF